MIPTTVSGLLVLLLAILPGIPGDQVYRGLAGVSWHERESHLVLRLLTFSILGLAAYALISVVAPLPPPAYVDPAVFLDTGLLVDRLPQIALAYCGHFAGATIVASAAAGARRVLSNIAVSSGNRDAWDHFVTTCVPHHWVVLTLKTGESYAGILDHADIAVAPEYRDLILLEPAEFNPETKRFVSSAQQALFLTGSQIASVVTIYDSERDKDRRINPPGAALFEEVQNERPEITAFAADPASAETRSATEGTGVPAGKAIASAESTNS